RRLAMVERLAEIGMALAEALLRQVSEPGEAPVAAADAALAYSRIARAVRLTAALGERIERALASGAAASGAASPDGSAQALDAGRAAEVTARVKARLRLQLRKEEVRHVAGCAIAAQAREGVTEGVGEAEVERLMAGLDERMTDRELDDAAWLERPLGELVARLCRDLGVRYDPRLWEDDGGAADDGAALAADGTKVGFEGGGGAVVAAARAMGGPVAARGDGRPP
ncbi:MAG: hypothetical protein P4L73_03630, partial [Caulobacteraceae bacterium]|nr:hypothetical protein [Caulobacteraceae bacterium]